jgi:hypothetical protein
MFLSSLTGRRCLFCLISQHFVLGYFRDVPAGLIFSNPNSDPDRGSSSSRAAAAAGPVAHFERNDVTIICETVHYC